ncbi:glycoside hydrolase superfamily [Aspergillus unguis]
MDSLLYLLALVSATQALNPERNSTFSYFVHETLRYATPNPTPTTTTTYGPPYSKAVQCLQTTLATTTWGSWLPGQTNVTATDHDVRFGQAAWSSMWEGVGSLRGYTTTGLYATTASPTPIPTEELILPPKDYFGPTDNYTFPDGFVFGVAGSASQIEGAIALEGRSPTLMDVWEQETDLATDFVTNENYFLYKQDIARLAAMGVKYYSFSIAWSRILPFALPGTPVNQQGIDHYDDLINTVLDAGMQPIVTVTHFDSPLVFLQGENYSTDLGVGVSNGGYHNETFVDAFVNYGKILFTHFADRVPFWITFNEPIIFTYDFAGLNNVVHAHAQLYHYYHDTLGAAGKISLKLANNYATPLDIQNPDDIAAANRVQEMYIDAFANPIYLGKQYPDCEELAYLANTADFFAIDSYTTVLATQPEGGIQECAGNQSHPLWPVCVESSSITQTGWDIGYRSESYVYITPKYLREFLGYLWTNFHYPIMLTEFGFPVYGEGDRALADQRFDTPRSIYYLSCMSEILKAVHEDGVNMLGALAWSFADNWEFGDYAQQFGLQVVNRTTQERFYKKSFFDLVDFVKERTL